MIQPKKILIIQTAFIGDAILASSVLESLHVSMPNAQLDILVRKGNESLFAHHPFLGECLVWNKRDGKYRSLWNCLKKIRKNRYDLVLNLHRFASSGFLTAFSGAPVKRGFDKNPLSFLFTEKFLHRISDKQAESNHETQRYFELIADLCDQPMARPRLYPSAQDFDFIGPWTKEAFITISPATVWFTKGFPEASWKEFLRSIDGLRIYVLGGPSDAEMCKRIAEANPMAVSLAGKLSLLQSAALMSKAILSYTNDSAPLHLCSAMNAPVAAIFCSTVPAFGFGPLSDFQVVIETQEKLDCRPCGLHGFKECPQKHFKCSNISIKELHQVLNDCLKRSVS